MVAAATAVALAGGTTAGSRTLPVELVSAASSNFLQHVAGTLPGSYAFAAGMLAAVNPCGFACLPAYLGIFVGGRGGSTGVGEVPRALAVSVMVTATFVVLFGLSGILVGLFASAVSAYFPLIGLLVGIVLALAGSRILSGAPLYTSLGDELAQWVGGARPRGLLGYGAFGVAYGLASLGCTLPIYLAVVGSALALHGVAAAVGQFILYGFGMGCVLGILTVTAAVFRLAAIRRVRGIVRYVAPIGGGMMLLTGGYVVYYWLTIGGTLAAVGL